MPSAGNRFLLVGASLALLLIAAGCRDRQVAAYRVPKERAAAPAAESASPVAGPAGVAAAPVVAAGATLTWTAPADWRPKELGPMRKGSFTLAGPDGAAADLSITAFPGAVGGELANLNRWRGQLSLEPVGEPELAGASSRVPAGDLVFTVVDLVGAGAQPQRILGAMAPFDRSMWFFKLSGPDALVAASKPAFLAFLQTVKASAPSTP